jgi:two-component system chemotaxis response regulator CheB
MQDPQAQNVTVVRDRRMPSSLIVIGAGTGGPQALADILSRFPATFSGTIIVVQQMRSGFTKVLSNQLNDECRLPVYEPVDGQELHASETLVVPGRTTLTIPTPGEQSPCVVRIEDVTDDPEKLRTRTDATMSSAAALYGRECIGVLLTGMGDDGRDGMRAIADAGGTTLAQDEESSVVFDLPSSAIDGGAAHEVLPLWSIADRIMSISSGEAQHADAA